MKRITSFLIMGLWMSCYMARTEDNPAYGVPLLNVTPRPSLSEIPEDMNEEVNLLEIMEILKEKGILKVVTTTDESNNYEIEIQWNPKYSFMTYEWEIFSNDASNITLYLPFPYYKGKPDKKVLKWLRKNLACEAQRHYNPEFREIISNINIDLVKTDYGKMLSLYIPKLSSKIEPNISFRIGYGGMFGQEIAIDKKKIIYDYKLNPCSRETKETSTATTEGDSIMPIYASFEGGTITIKSNFYIWTPSEEDDFVSLYYAISPFEIEKSKSGWHWFPVRKETKDLKR
ncbi:MAG: hypothetical protein AB1297_02400 [bacterium]